MAQPSTDESNSLHHPLGNDEDPFGLDAYEKAALGRNVDYEVVFNDIRSALAAGTDTADDLIALELALKAAIEEEEPLDPERRQSALRSIARLLQTRAVLLHQIFAYLWDNS